MCVCVRGLTSAMRPVMVIDGPNDAIVELNSKAKTTNDVLGSRPCKSSRAQSKSTETDPFQQQQQQHPSQPIYIMAAPDGEVVLPKVLLALPGPSQR